MAEKKESTSSRDYYVLRRATERDAANPSNPDDVTAPQFELVTKPTIVASGAEQAIHLVASEQGPGRFIAIPARSWSERNVRVETPAPKIYVDEVGPTQKKTPTAAGAAA